MIERLAGKAASDRAGRIACILAESFDAADQRWSRESVAGTLDVPRTVAFLAPAGCAILRIVADEAEILTVAVLPSARRLGLGARLVAACLAEAAAGGATRLHLEVAESNAAARALYLSSGFAESGRRAGYYRRAAVRESAVLMVRGVACPAPRRAGA